MSAFQTAPPGSLKVLQFTDTHLFADPGATLGGVETDTSLRACLDLAQRRHWPPDLILWTGDLAHEAEPAAYERLRQLCAGLPCPSYAIAGNHDQPALLHAHWAGPGRYVGGVHTRNAWQFIMLDSTVAGCDGGALAAAELQRLEQALAARPQHYTVLCLHHHPVPIGSAWMDAMQLAGAAELVRCIQRYPRVRVVLWGHIHQVWQARRYDVEWLGSPSTCCQFAPRSAEFRLDPQPPGYRWLVLEAQGTVRSGVQRLPAAAVFRPSGETDRC